MNISINLHSSPTISFYDLLGNITISTNNGIIQETYTYIDSWFTCLIKGHRSLEQNKSITLDIAEEPNLIIFNYVGESNFKIIYGKQEVFFTNLKDFSKALAYPEVNSVPRLSESETLEYIEYLKSQSLL